MAVDWANGIEWGSGVDVRRDPVKFYDRKEFAWGDVDAAGASSKFAPTEQNQALLRSMGYAGDMTATAPSALSSVEGYDSSMDEPVWTADALRYLADKGYGIAVGHQPGTSSGGRAEFYGLVGPDGKYVDGQSDPKYIMSDTLMDNVLPFLMVAGPFASAISTSMAAGAAGAGASAGAGAAAGAGVGAGTGSLSAAADGLTALGSSWSPQSLGLTGSVSSGLGAADLAALSQALPGAAPSLGQTIGMGALKGAGMGAVKGAITGENILKSAAQGAIGGAVGGAVSGFNPAGSLGVESAAGKGLINGAISGGVRSAVGGGNFVQGALSGGISGGVNGLNPGGAVLSDPKAAGIINSAVSGALQGRNPSQLGQQALGGLLSLAGSKSGQLLGSLTNGGGHTLSDPVPFDNAGEYDPEKSQEAMKMGDESDDWSSWDKAVEEFLQSRDSDVNYGNEGRAYSSDNPYQLDASTDSPVNSSGSGSWWDSVLSGLSGAVTGSGKSGSTLFSSDSILGALFGGIQGKDVLGMLGSGVSATMLERQAEKNREFQKELQDRQWAREDALAAERRARMKPVTTPGLINAQISTIPGTTARVGG